MRLHWTLVGIVGLAVGCGSGSGTDDPVRLDLPRAVILASALTGSTPMTVDFDGVESTPGGDAEVASYLWDFGDGTQWTGMRASHTFASAGTFPVTLTVTNTRALSGQAGVSVRVTDSQGAPTAVIAADRYAGLSSLAVSFDASASQDSDGTIEAYRWEFGDGATSTAVSPSHTFGEGVYTVVLTVTDDRGLEGYDETTIAVASFDNEVVRLVNVERLGAGSLPPIRDESHLFAAALRHSADMATNRVNDIDHVGTDGSTFDQRIRDAGYTGYSSIGENIAAGYSTPASVMNGWMNSSGHRANILNSSFRELGASHVWTSSGPYYHFWTQDFGARTNGYPVVIEREAFSTANASVTLYIHGSGWAEEMQVSSRADFAGAVWEPHSATKTWSLGSALGTRTVYVKLRRGSTEVVSSDTIVRVEG